MIKIINETTLEIDGINYTNFDKVIVNEVALLQNELIKYNKAFKDLLSTNNDYFNRLSDALEYIDRKDIDWGSEEHDKLVEILKGGEKKIMNKEEIIKKALIILHTTGYTNELEKSLCIDAIENLQQENKKYKSIIEKTIKELDIWANNNLDKDLPIYDKLMFILNHYDGVEEGDI